MATSSSNTPENSLHRKRPGIAHTSKARIAGYAAIGLIVIALAWVAFNFRNLQGNAIVGTGYASHLVCSCRYIEGRDLKSCLTDFEPGMELVSITDNPDTKTITASVPLLAKAMAQRRGANGCMQLNNAEMDAAG
jgi:hypothetical protein